MRKKYPFAIDNMIAEAAEEAAEGSRLDVLNKLVREGAISMQKAAEVMDMKEEEFAAKIRENIQEK